VLRRRSQERRSVESDVDLSGPEGPHPPSIWVRGICARGAQIWGFRKAEAAPRIETCERGVDSRCSRGNTCPHFGCATDGSRRA
jgi:hypothetical protein